MSGDRQPQRHDIRHGQPAATGHRLSRQYLPASPHRAGHFAGIHPEDAPYTTGDDIEVGEADEALYPRSHSSAIRYNQPAAAVEKRVRYEFRPGQTIPRRAHAVSPGGTNTTGDVPGLIPQKRAHAPSWLLYIGVGMLAMLALWAGLHTLLSWWQVRSDDSTYGYPRTYQFDAVVGHSDSRNNPTHIIIINLNQIGRAHV